MSRCTVLWMSNLRNNLLFWLWQTRQRCGTLWLCLRMYDKLNVVGICFNKNQGENVFALITKFNEFNTLFSRNSHYKFYSENSWSFLRVIITNVIIKVKSTTHVFGNTLLHASIAQFICYNMLSWNRLSLTKYFVAWLCLNMGVQDPHPYCLGEKNWEELDGQGM